MKTLLNVFIKFERGTGDFRTILEFVCESISIIGPGTTREFNKDVTSIYQFNNILDKHPTNTEFEPLSKCLPFDNNNDLFDYYHEAGTHDKWVGEINSNYVTTLEITPFTGEIE